MEEGDELEDEGKGEELCVVLEWMDGGIGVGRWWLTLD
jgi:hypothetical protein